VLALALTVGAAMHAVSAPNSARWLAFGGGGAELGAAGEGPEGSSWSEAGGAAPPAPTGDRDGDRDGGRDGDSLRPYRPDLNHSPAHRLRLLRGLGPVRAAALVDERRRGGEFRSFEEVARRVHGLGPVTVGRLASCADLGAGPIPVDAGSGGEVEPALLALRLDQREDLE
jgi:hypothetical protein